MDPRFHITSALAQVQVLKARTRTDQVEDLQEICRQFCKNVEFGGNPAKRAESEARTA
jgi:hypothetical protein